MVAVVIWVRHELRTRAVALIGLLLLVAFATATITAAGAGGRRGATAVDRLLDRTLPATVAALPNDGAFDWDAVRALPEVESLSAFAVSSVWVEGLDIPDPSQVATFPPTDADVWRSIERPVVLDGRIPDPARADEVAVTSGFVSHSGLGVGDTVSLRLYTPEEMGLDLASDSPPTGPLIEATVVGVLRSGWFSDTSGHDGAVLLSPGLHAAFEENIVGGDHDISINALVRLRRGAADIPAFEAGLESIAGRPVEIMDLAAEADRMRDLTGFEAKGLGVFALVAAVAAFVLIGQAVGRYVSSSAEGVHRLHVLGMRGRDRLLAAMAAPVAVGVAGVAVGLAAAWAVSNRFPIGSARHIEASPGRHVDWVVVVLVGAGIAAVVTLVAWSSSRYWARSAGDTPGALSVAVAESTAGLPVPVATGCRLALTRGGGRGVSPRQALVASVLGVAGVVGALTFANGVSDATGNLSRFGQSYDAAGFFGEGGRDFIDPGPVLAAAAEIPGVDGVIDAKNDVATIDGDAVALYSYAPVGEPVDVVVVRGIVPTVVGDVALAPTTAEELGVDVGDRVTATAGDRTIDLYVSGIAFVPSGPHNGYDAGGWISGPTYDRLFDDFKFHFWLLSTEPGTDVDAVVDQLAAMGAMVQAGPIIEPSQRAELRQIRSIPMALALFVVLLAVGATVHVLMTTARQRRREFAVMQAMGMTRRAARWAVTVQAAIIAAVGVLVGMPVGYVIGRSAWRIVAEDTPVLFVDPLDWPLLALTPVVAVGMALLLAVVPTREVGRLRVASVLRSE